MELDAKGTLVCVPTANFSDYRSKSFLEYDEIPCGKCRGCLLDRSREWANRCMMEMKYHDSAYFVTLTYNDDFIPCTAYGSIDTGEAIGGYSLRKRDFQLFMKRLRKAVGNDKIRYFACGEYGSKTLRPHYHAILFGLKLDDLVVYSRPAKGDLNYSIYTSDFIQKVWSVGGLPIGHVTVGDVSWETCAYVARYVLKKGFGDAAAVYDDFNIEPEFVVMSRKSGIGKRYFDDHPDLMEYDSINISTASGGHSFSAPRYFKKLYERCDPIGFKSRNEKFKKVGENSKNLKMTLTSVTYSDLLETRERNLVRSSNSLIREL